MILSKLFSSKANWQHKDASTRITCIENELNTNNDQDLQILRQIIDNDLSDIVRRAALIKIDSVSLWVEKGLNDTAPSTVKLAESKIVDHITTENSALSLEEKLSVIEQLPRSFSEKVLAQANNADLVISLMEKIAKPQLLPVIFANKPIEKIQQYIVEQTEQISSLEKLAKKAQLKVIQDLIADKINTIKTLSEKPAKLQKEGQLILSKLLALKDTSDYQLVLSKRNELITQWDSIKSEFTYLSEEKSAEFTEKYQNITDTLTKLFAAKEEQYQQAKIAESLAAEQSALKSEFNLFIEQTTQAITTAIFENDAIDEVKVVASIDDFNHQVTASQLSQKDKDTFIKKGKALNERLSKIGEIANSVATATHLISRMAQQQPPELLEELTAKQEIYKAWLKDWKNNLNIASGVLPSSITDAFEEINTNWIRAIAPLEKAQQKQFHQCQRKVSDLKRLLATGKYNAAFGVFKKFKQLFDLLSTEHKKRLNRDYEQLSEKISELSDWEHYIATPRKQELLNEINQLVTSPLDNPIEQANKVKQYRQTWNTLGHADDDIDNELNQSFNNACEQAFAPCRQFYAEQEKIREQHLATRKNILKQANTLVAEFTSETIETKKLETRLNQLIQQWREAGEVDRNVYRDINEQFQNAIKPVKQYIGDYHRQNMDKKLSIIEQAEQLLADSDVFEAVNSIKSLQTQWKSIGYAGVKKENDLWRKFRAINDQIFAKRSEVNVQRKQESDALKADIESKLNELNQSLAKAETSSEVNHVIDQARTSLTSLQNEKHVNKPAVKLVESFISECQSKLKQIRKNAIAQDWQRIFNLITLLASNEISQQDLQQLMDYQQLSSNMKSRFDGAINFDVDSDRLTQTIELEIIAGIDSPTHDQKLRMEKQIALMQEKMSSGSLQSTEDKFWEWLAASKFKQEDLAHIERIKSIFL